MVSKYKESREWCANFRRIYIVLNRLQDSGIKSLMGSCVVMALEVPGRSLLLCEEVITPVSFYCYM